MPFDVLIPLGPNDEDIVERCVESVRTYVLGVRNIYIVASRPIQVKGATQVLDESIFPFTKEEIGKLVLEKRAGWYLQQLIKLYGPLLIPGCLPDCLIVDADVIFFQRVRFMDGSKYLFDKNHETHPPYFSHMKRLHPSFVPAFRNTSGIVNIMIYNQEILKEIFRLVEEHHKDVFWKAFLQQVAPNEFSGASEYELYFHYICRTKPNRIMLRPLRYNNFGLRSKIEAGDWHYVTYHHHYQKKALK
jgi:hypothetical protein